MNFDSYLNQGLLKKQKANFKQIEKQILRAEKDLKTFQLVVNHDAEWASSIVYQAMLRTGRALLFANGLLPADGQQHKTVVKITGKILGTQFETLIRKFNRLRKKRNVFFYDSEDSGNFMEAKIALQNAKDLISEIKKKIEALNPQLPFNW